MLLRLKRYTLTNLSKASLDDEKKLLEEMQAAEDQSKARRDASRTELRKLRGRLASLDDELLDIEVSLKLSQDELSVCERAPSPSFRSGKRQLRVDKLLKDKAGPGGK